MKMRNHEIESFVNFLMGEEASSKNSRMRSRFIRIVNDHLNTIEQERQILIKEHVELDENGEPLTEDINGNGVISYVIRDRNKFNQDYYEMMLEELIIEETEDKKEMLEAVKQIVLGTNKMFKGQEAIDYDRWCDIVEGIQE